MIISERIVEAIVAEQEKLGGCLPNKYTRTKWAEAVAQCLKEYHMVEMWPSSTTDPDGIPSEASPKNLRQSFQARLDRHQKAIEQLRDMMQEMTEFLGRPKAREFTQT